MQLNLAIMTESGWQAGMNDPGLTGMVTVGCYFLTSVLCLRRLWKLTAQRRLSAARHPLLIWSGLAILLCGLGISKQLDLHNLLTSLGRSLASTQGWYDQRHLVQVIFIAMVALVFLSCVMLIVTHYPRTSRRHRLALLGAIFLGSFLITRTVSLHHLDAMFHWRLGGLTVNWMLELVGISLIAIAAGWNVRWRIWQSSGNLEQNRGQDVQAIGL